MKIIDINKVTALIIAIICIGFSASATSYTANEVLNKASQKINSAKSVTAQFSGSATGTLTVSGNKFAYSMDTQGFGVWYDGTNMWTYSKNAGETSLTNPTASELIETNPIEIIKNYQAKFDATKVSETGSKYTIKLTPKSKGNNVKTATLVINTSTWLPVSFDITFTNGQRMNVNITSISTGDALPASNFVYPKSKYPGVEVIDLR